MARVDPERVGHGRDFPDPRAALEAAEGVYRDRVLERPTEERLTATRPRTEAAFVWHPRMLGG